MDTPEQPPQFATAEFVPELPDSHALFVRGVLFGVGGALLGLILYAAVGIITGFMIGFVSLAVGYIVGKSILFGSRGRTGRRYQFAAVALTYAAVALAAVPIAISQLAKSAPAVAEPAADLPPIALGSVIFELVKLGLMSPFLELQDLPSGLIGLVILAVGLQIAWKITGGPEAAMREALASAAPPDDKPTSLDLQR